MVYDFVMALEIWEEPENPVPGSLMNEMAFFLGLDESEYYYSNVDKRMPMLSVRTINRRLRPLVLDMFYLIESNDSYYGWRTRKSVRMLIDYYGIGVKRLDIEQIVRKHHVRNEERAMAMISRRMHYFAYSPKFSAWTYLFVMAFYLPNKEYEKLLSAIEEKNKKIEERKAEYGDVIPMYKCIVQRRAGA